MVMDVYPLSCLNANLNLNVFLRPVLDVYVCECVLAKMSSAIRPLQSKARARRAKCGWWDLIYMIVGD